ncbi:MAG TPA: SDR family NAD(P)-dependent oxidoreductase [Acidimicrobiales bacterium]|nr:SDR family NAD(P)-dependent oxidoreductase [Acidimicrobiales bacterium]
MAADLEGRTFLVTGANTGIGRATALSLAARGGRVHLACRSEEKAAPVIDEIAAAGGPAAGFVPLDLADLDSVRAGAAAFLAGGERLDVLVDNAGVGGQRGTTAQGFELTFGVNHLGHFLLTTLLLDHLRAGERPRIVVVASDEHFKAKGIDFDALRAPTATYTGLPEYAVSKLCNVLFAQELARRLEGTGVTTYALHPGVIASDIYRRLPRPVEALAKLFMKSPAQGAATSLYCATDPAVAADSGRYYEKCSPRAASPVATPELGAELWARSVAWTAA